MTDPVIKLYHYWRSSCSWRVRWALNIKKIPHTLIVVDLLTAEHKKDAFQQKSPMGMVPCIEYQGKYFHDSMAIIEWMDEEFDGPNLLPTNLEDRMIVRSLANIIASGTQPLQNLSPMRYFSTDEAKQKSYAIHWNTLGLTAYERALANHKSLIGRCSYGNEVTIADLCLIPQVYNATERLGMNLQQYPLLKKINEYCLSTPECQAAHPSQFKVG